jgi:hypothetical protein
LITKTYNDIDLAANVNIKNLNRCRFFGVKKSDNYHVLADFTYLILKEKG